MNLTIYIHTYIIQFNIIKNDIHNNKDMSEIKRLEVRDICLPKLRITSL